MNQGACDKLRSGEMLHPALHYGALREALSCGLPPGPVVETGRPGCQHRYYQAPRGLTGRTTRQGTAHAIDILAGGIAVVPPSLHRTGRRYRWLLAIDRAAPQPAPSWALQLLRRANSVAARPVDLPGDLPGVHVQDLRVSERVKRLIMEGPAGQPGLYASRSEAVFAVAHALIASGYDNSVIAAVLFDPELRISEKPRAQGRSWLAAEIGRARQKFRGNVTRFDGLRVRVVSTPAPAAGSIAEGTKER